MNVPSFSVCYLVPFMFNIYTINIWKKMLICLIQSFMYYQTNLENWTKVLHNSLTAYFYIYFIYLFCTCVLYAGVGLCITQYSCRYERKTVEVPSSQIWVPMIKLNSSALATNILTD